MLITQQLILGTVLYPPFNTNVGVGQGSALFSIIFAIYGPNHKNIYKKNNKS